MKASKRRKLEEYRAQLRADIATAARNLKELCYTSERYPGELDQAIGALSRGIAFARARLAEIEKGMILVTNDESYGCIVCGEAPCICFDTVVY